MLGNTYQQDSNLTSTRLGNLGSLQYSSLIYNEKVNKRYGNIDVIITKLASVIRQAVTPSFNLTVKSVGQWDSQSDRQSVRHGQISQSTSDQSVN